MSHDDKQWPATNQHIAEVLFLLALNTRSFGRDDA